MTFILSRTLCNLSVHKFVCLECLLKHEQLPLLLKLFSDVVELFYKFPNKSNVNQKSYKLQATKMCSTLNALVKIEIITSKEAN